ncbi:MAG: hypothetical protein HYR96_03030 [Deltaproteobacteria bacterium]|nr:hypothetical protein [Deltaproteobacteria bacterium]MBI3294073.1 hypothetical protein [Deltaproteobacteria bacterium]
MKTLFLILTLLTIDSFACVDLSHIERISGEVDLQVKQTSCDEWVRQQFVAGNPIGDPVPLKLGPDWGLVEVDDDYEKYTMHQKWAWTSDQTKVIHEVTWDSFDKGTEELSFLAQSTYYAIDGRFVTEKGTKVKRTLHPNGEIEYKTDRIDARYPRLE